LSGTEAAYDVPFDPHKIPVALPLLSFALLIAAVMVGSANIELSSLQLSADAASVPTGPYLLPLSSYQSSACPRIVVRLDLMEVLAALTRALFRDTSTTDERMPMIAITTKSSIRVKPLLAQ